MGQVGHLVQDGPCSGPASPPHASSPLPTNPLRTRAPPFPCSADEVVVSVEGEGLVDEVREITGGRGAYAAVECIGGQIFAQVGRAGGGLRGGQAGGAAPRQHQMQAGGGPLRELALVATDAACTVPTRLTIYLAWLWQARCDGSAGQHARPDVIPGCQD